MSRTETEAAGRAAELLRAMTPCQRDSWIMAGDNLLRARRGTSFTISIMGRGIFVEAPLEADNAD